ncbi:MAG TPA: cytochrome c [Chloroflexaceae bacterium]|nr:cytochrome c [Chloroflexaceae bacterium]
MTRPRTLTAARLARIAWLPLCLLLAACHVDMYDQPRYTANQPSEFFADGRSMRVAPENTVAMGSFDPDSAMFTGRVNGELATELPMELTADLLERGQTRYDAFCAPCHGLAGDGNGVIAYRGPIQVPTLHNDRLRTVAIGYYFDVITNGVNRMYSYANRIPPEDRWAVAAYVRALQLSQNANAADLSAEERAQLGGQ